MGEERSSSPTFIIINEGRMRKTSVFSAILLLLTCLFAGCRDKSVKEVPLHNKYLRPASMNYSREDTTDINGLVNQYVENLRAKNFEANAELLYNVKNGEAVAYTEEQKKQYLDVFSHIRFYDCKVNSFLLRSDKNNEVSILLKVVESGDLDKGIGVTSMSLNPVKIGDKWYLTLLDKDAEGVEDIYGKKK